jgi:hypothetical protein
VHANIIGREKQFRVDEAQLARAVAQSADVCAAGTPGSSASKASPR